MLNSILAGKQIMMQILPVVNLEAEGNDFRLKETVEKKFFLSAPYCRPIPFTQSLTSVSVSRHMLGLGE